MMKDGAGPEEAEDVAQEAMLQVVQAWSRIDNPRAWVRKAAYNVRPRQAPRGRRELPGSTVAVSVAVEADAADMCGQEARIVAVMLHLPPAQRRVAALFYDGWSQQEIADVVDKPVATVRSLLRHARVRLKEVVQSENMSSRTNP